MKRMVGLICLFLVLFAGEVPAQVSKFQYRPEAVETGVAYHYAKTNIDGSNPEMIVVYVASKDRLEVFKYHPEEPGSRAALVTADMDWSTFSVRKLESWALMSSDQKILVAVMNYLPKEMAVDVEVPAMQKPVERTAIPYLPFHVYNFDLTGLNFAIRHLKDPKSGFTIGIADPNMNDDGPVFLYRGEVDVTFAGEEARDGVPCRKYKIDGPGVNNRGGHVWVHSTKGHFVDVEMAMPDNPDWDNFKLKLRKTEKMTPERWTRFVNGHFVVPAPR